MSRLFRTASLIVLAMLAGAAMLAGLILFALRLTIYAQEPADFLPAATTVALLHAPTKDVIHLWETVFPVLTELPDGTYDAIGILNEENEWSVVGFTHGTDKANNRVGSYSVRTGAANVHMAEHGETTVRHAPDYLLLTRAIQQPSWTYVSKQTSGEHHSIGDMLLSNLLWNGASGAGVHVSSGQTEITTVLPSYAVQHTLHMPALNDRVIAVSMYSAAEAWQTLAMKFPVLEGILSAGLQHLGPSASLRYDLLPLLAEPSTLQFSMSGSFASVLISGSLHDEKQLNTLLERFHTAYRTALPATVVTQRVLDKRFTSIDIRYDDTQIQESQEQRDGWLIRGTQHTSEKGGLFSAVSGADFLMSTSGEAILHAMSQPPGPEESRVLVHGTGAGLVLKTLLSPELLPQYWQHSDVVVTEEQSGRARILRLNLPLSRIPLF